jgi:hypothetical protein
LARRAARTPKAGPAPAGVAPRPALGDGRRERLRPAPPLRGLEWAFAYIPIVGGVIEIAVVFLFWMAILQAWRASRPLRREWRLWVGALLALVPPVADLAVYVLTAH